MDKTNPSILTEYTAGKIAWILLVISSQIGNGGTIGLFLLIILFKFLAEGASGLLRYRSVKVL